jgi:hypothetical protein
MHPTKVELLTALRTVCGLAGPDKDTQAYRAAVALVVHAERAYRNELELALQRVATIAKRSRRGRRP